MNGCEIPWVMEPTSGRWGRAMERLAHGRVRVEWWGEVYSDGLRPWRHQRPSLSRPVAVVQLRPLTAAEWAQVPPMARALTGQEVSR